MQRPVLLSTAAAVAALLSTTPAVAQGMGLEGLHDHRREGGKVCMVDHFHDGTGSGKTRKLAESEAARSWSEFTSWEYGGRWGAYGNAANKSMNCSNAGGAWPCQGAARPCRAGR